MQTEITAPRVQRLQRAWIPDALLHVPHNDGEITFAYPSFGPRDYRMLGEQILLYNFFVPTGDLTASLLHAAYCRPDVRNLQEFQDVRLSQHRQKPLYIFNRNLWTDKGVYVILDSKSVGLRRQFESDINTLEKTLEGGEEIEGIKFSRDNMVRFAPESRYRLGEHTSKSFAKDGFIIANCGLEGAEKMGEVSAQFKNKPCSYGIIIKKGQEPMQRVSMIENDWHDGLSFSGNYLDSIEGSAFGVCGELQRFYKEYLSR